MSVGVFAVFALVPNTPELVGPESERGGVTFIKYTCLPMLEPVME